jgi:non-homologous end joining protein Ku
MDPRNFWKGYLKLSLVTCRVSMMLATTEGEKVRFHTLNRSTENHVISQYLDSVTGKVVEEEDAVKGYERGEGEYVMLEDEELSNLRVPASTPLFQRLTSSFSYARTSQKRSSTSRRCPQWADRSWLPTAPPRVLSIRRRAIRPTLLSEIGSA